MTNRKVLAALFAGLACTVSATALAQSQTTEIGRISVGGDAVGSEGARGPVLGNGNIVAEETPKARSTVTKDAIQNLVATSNPFQAINKLPGVNASSDDATGLYGGELSIRGFKSDQLGFTVDGVPVNDSGNYAVYPQEFVDTENLEEIYVTQGSADMDSPHVGATGGNVNLVTKPASDTMGVFLRQTIGQDNMFKSAIKLNSGKMGPDGPKGYLYYSRAESDKWRGKGKARRDHLEAKLQYETPDGRLHISASGLYNRAINHPFRQLTLAEYQQFGRKLDYDTVWAGKLTPVAGKPQDESSNVGLPPGSTGRNQYYDLYRNPFENFIGSVNINYQVTDNLRVDLLPYYWYGFGNGIGPNFLSEKDALLGGPRDLNGDGDTLDRLMYFRSSVTQTLRPGVISKVSYQLDNIRVSLGYWLERAKHRQTQPYGLISDGGTPLDVWLRNDVVTRTDLPGVPVQGRDQRTKSNADQLFGEITGKFFNEQLIVVAGLRNPVLERVGYNYVVSTTPIDRYVKKTYRALLPSLGVTYKITPEHQVYANVAKTFRAPQNYTLYETPRNSSLMAETAWTGDIGYRYTGQQFIAAAQFFASNFKNRQVSSYDIESGLTRNINSGRVHYRGIELEVGTAPFYGFTAYASASYTHSEIMDDLRANKDTVLPLKGKKFTDTPEFMAALDIQYNNENGFFAGITPKYTGGRYGTLLNDEKIGSNIVVDAFVGYRFPDFGPMRNSTLRLNVQNLFDENYLASIKSPQTNAKPFGTANGQTVRYLPGAERFVSVSFSTEF